MALVSSIQAVPHICVFGGPSSGKTTLVAELSNYFDLLWFDIDNGWSVMKSLPPANQARIDLIHLPDSATYPIAAETWPKLIRGTLTKICVGHGKVNCPICTKDGGTMELVELNAIPRGTVVVFDSLTQFGISTISHITKNQPDDYKLQLDDWGKLKVAVEKFLSQIQAAPFAVVCITHEEVVECEDGRERLVPVCGSSKSSRNTAKYFSDIIYCQVKNMKHMFTSKTTASSNVLTGSRAGIDIATMATPSLLPFFEAYAPASQVQSPSAQGSIVPIIPTPASEKEMNTIQANASAVRLQEIQAKLAASKASKG